MTSTDRGRVATPHGGRGPAVSARGGRDDLPPVQIMSVGELAEAAALVGDALVEVPVFDWVLGESADDLAARELLAEVLLAPMAAAGRMLGVRGSGDGRLVGVLAWQPPDEGSAPDPAALRADAERLMARPGMARRLVELWRRDLMPAPAPTSVSIPIAALAPHSRGGDLLASLVRPVEEYCTERDCSFYVWTGVEKLREAFARGWRLTEFDRVELGDGTALYGLVSEIAPLAVRT
ncbi:MAG: hypothetical protein WBA05_14545 [Gordonia sp. (in: high G+C Gram-positive bacteria)]|uniref:hypothetical protein n=1 Tax=Gordonia TaxID=2053 RepID=UPI0032631642